MTENDLSFAALVRRQDDVCVVRWRMAFTSRSDELKKTGHIRA